MRGILVVQIISIFFIHQLVFAEQNINECLEISRQLEVMAEAQNKILNALVKKNDALADTLDHFADDLGGVGQKVKKADLVTLRQSAKSFRGHTVRESELVEKFGQKTGLLVEKISECMHRNGYQNSSGPETLPKAKVVQNSRDSNNQTQR